MFCDLSTLFAKNNGFFSAFAPLRPAGFVKNFAKRLQFCLLYGRIKPALQFHAGSTEIQRHRCILFLVFPEIVAQTIRGYSTRALFFMPAKSIFGGKVS